MQSDIYMDESEISQAISRLAKGILSRNKNLDRLAIVGIKNRGEYIARRILSEIEKESSLKCKFGTLDITLYRDDFDRLGDLTLGETDLLFDVSGKRLILVDDVLYSGRTIRAALDQVMDFGRPAEIELAVLVDRGGRELPICANYLGKRIEVGEDEYIRVQLTECDGVDRVIRINKDN